MERPSINIFSGFTAIQMLLRIYPKRFREDGSLIDRVLRAFVMTIIPGAPLDDPNLIRMYLDSYYPFCPYSGFLAYDLVRRSRKLHGVERFDELSQTQRTAVVQSALGSDETVSRLYKGAILMAQVSFYGGIYDPEKGCPLIDFPGRNNGYFPREMFYSDAQRFLAVELTGDGNPP
jgi:hypothetical protein